MRPWPIWMYIPRQISPLLISESSFSNRPLGGYDHFPHFLLLHSASVGSKAGKNMGLHLVLLAKLKLLATSHCPGPVFAALLWPFALKIPLSGCISRACTRFSVSSVLIVFRLSQVLFQEQSIRHGHRWERALRVLCERADVTRRRFSTAQSHETSLHSVSMLAL